MVTFRTRALLHSAALGLFVSLLASCGGSSSSTATITKVIVIPTISSVSINGQRTFTANALDKDGNGVTSATYTWASSDSEVATIDSSGLAVGKSAGKAQITATASGVTSSPASLTVLPVIDSVTITPVSAAIKVGEQQQFSATAKDAKGNTISDAVFDWAVSFSGVATIDKNGLVTGVSAGTVLITASAGGKTSLIATLNITK